MKRKVKVIWKEVHGACEREFDAARAGTFITIFIKVVFSLGSYHLSLAWLHFTSPWERPLCFLLSFLTLLLFFLSLQKQAETSRWCLDLQS